LGQEIKDNKIMRLILGDIKFGQFL